MVLHRGAFPAIVSLSRPLTFRGVIGDLASRHVPELGRNAQRAGAVRHDPWLLQSAAIRTAPAVTIRGLQWLQAVVHTATYEP
jgi:hypothetical protein